MADLVHSVGVANIAELLFMIGIIPLQLWVHRVMDRRKARRLGDAPSPAGDMPR
jgi:hypothetical protein